MTTKRRKTRDFLSTFSHEARAHLGLIRSYAEMLLNVPPKAEEQRTEFLAVIRDEADYLTGLLNQVVAMERIERNEMAWQLRPVLITAVLERALLACENERADKGVVIKLETDDDLPLLSIDETALRQAFLHLLHNALRFSRRNSPVNVRVSRSQAPEGSEEIHVVIEDKGIGIHSDELDRVFDKFYKASVPVDGSPDGSGIGLSYARSVIRAFQGRIEIESTQNRGTTVTVCLPLSGPGADVGG